MSSSIRIPESLPIPVQDTFQDTFEKSTSRTVMEIGAPRQRRTRSIAPRLFTVSFDLSLAEFQTFEYWFQNDVQGGSVRFDMQVLDDDYTLVWYTVTMVGMYTYENTGPFLDQWTVTMRVRSKLPSFTTRVPGTNDLHGDMDMEMTFAGNLSVPYVMRGVMNMDTTFQAQLGAGPMIGRMDMAMDAYAMIDPAANETLIGESDMEMTLTGQFL